MIKRIRRHFVPPSNINIEISLRADVLQMGRSTCSFASQTTQSLRRSYIPQRQKIWSSRFTLSISSSEMATRVHRLSMRSSVCLNFGAVCLNASVLYVSTIRWLSPLLSLLGRAIEGLEFLQARGVRRQHQRYDERISLSQGGTAPGSRLSIRRQTYPGTL